MYVCCLRVCVCCTHVLLLMQVPTKGAGTLLAMRMNEFTYVPHACMHDVCVVVSVGVQVPIKSMYGT